MAASHLLNQHLGAVTHVEQNGRYIIRGEGCPLSAPTGKHPALCRAMESLVKEFDGHLCPRVLPAGTASSLLWASSGAAETRAQGEKSDSAECLPTA